MENPENLLVKVYITTIYYSEATFDYIAASLSYQLYYINYQQKMGNNYWWFTNRDAAFMLA